MSGLPKLNVAWHPSDPEDGTVYPFEEANEILFKQGLDILIFVEGQMVSSYEELIDLSSQDHLKDKKILKVLLVSVVAGG
jgi:hypothetical protein